MFRKLILASAVSLALLPGTSWSLGLGGIRTQSALNEPFLGEIDLYEVKPDEVGSVKVRLASKEDFEKAGSPWSSALKKLHFKAQPAGSGAIIEITSQEPVREPYLDFLIEVIWPEGRMVKGYTVLLDPPVTLQSLSSEVQPSVASRVSRRTAPPRDRTGYPLRYGPVKSGASLWKVARALAPSGATIAQTAMALYRSNQDAFIRGNINRLRRGVTLEIPTPDELFALDPGSAQREFSNAIAGRRVRTAPLTDIRQSAPRLEIASAPTPSSVSERSTAPQIPPSEGAAAGGGKAVEFNALQRELLLVQESAETNKQEAEELRSRVHELEGQLNDIRMLLKLRNEQIAQLRSGQGVLPEPSASATQEVPLGMGAENPAQGAPGESPQLPEAHGEVPPDVAMNPPEERQPPPVFPEMGTDLGVETTGQEETATPEPELAQSGMGETGNPPILPPEVGEPPILPPDTGIPPEQPLASTASQGITPPVSAEAPVSGEPEPPVIPDSATVESKKPSLTQKPAEPSFFDSFSLDSLSSPMLSAAIGVPISLGLFGFWWARRKKSEEEEEFLLPTPSEQLDVSEPGREADTESIDSNLPPSTDSFSLDKDTEEADILSEVDVYLSYERYREAESLLEQEIAASPEQLELKFKLAEVYHSSGNLKKLMSLREELRKAEAETQHPDLWEQVNRWVSELAEQSQPQDETPPSEPLDIPTSTPATSELDTIQQPISEVGPETSEMTAPFELSELAEEPFTQEPSSLTSGLSETTDEILPHTSQESKGDLGMDLSSVQGLDLEESDLDDIASTFPAEEEEETVPTEDQRDTMRVDGSSVFDSRMDDQDELNALDQSGLSSSDATTQTETVPQTSEEAGASESAAGDVFSSQWDMDSGLWDETGTKLDLARAYVEMEDADAARGILEEVIADGNEQQKSEAQEMLKRLGQ